MYDGLNYNLFKILYVYFYRYSRFCMKQLNHFENSIKMCLENLPVDLQNKYYDFAIFVYDLNIKPEVIKLYVISVDMSTNFETMLFQFRQVNL